ncbi:putative uncharacterized protein DDB_G0271606 [Uranotaenia lowii]|uniref:putative uncharacterized protein DDB_G0271606 n=1 Tax=Uranotaenia lowii TaxID=190385 RepID=UPI0024798A39|nr:putative uncharacterized protein DDB_G0271606 [Uranotaenia lowii]
MSDSIKADLQSSILLETLRQTPTIKEHHRSDSGGSGLPGIGGDGKSKGTSSSSLSLSSSADSGGGGGGGGNGTDGKSDLEAMDPAILSTRCVLVRYTPNSEFGESKDAPSFNNKGRMRHSGKDLGGSRYGEKSAVSEKDSQAKEKGNKSRYSPKELHQMEQSPDPENFVPIPTIDRENWMRYSVEELLALRNADISKELPPFMQTQESERDVKLVTMLARNPRQGFSDENGGNGAPAGYGRNRSMYSGNNDSGNGNGGGSSIERIEIRRSGGMDLRDPKDRLRKEDSIVLSPQRRNFNMGCQMPAAPTSGPSNLTIGSGLIRNERENLFGPRERRIGSGRILSRDVSWDYRPDKNDPESNDYRQSNNMPFRDRDRDARGESRDSRESRDARDSRDGRDLRDARDMRDSRDSRERMDRDKDYRKDYDRDRERDREDRYERRPLNRDYDHGDKEVRNPRMNSRYSNSYNDSHGGGGRYSNNHHSHHDRRRLYSDHRDEEPEWFSEPTSQTDTIELRGFDDPIPEDEIKPEKETKDIKESKTNSSNDRNNNANMQQTSAGNSSDDKSSSNNRHDGSAQLDHRTPGDGACEGNGSTKPIGHQPGTIGGGIGNNTGTGSSSSAPLGGIANILIEQPSANNNSSKEAQPPTTDDDFNFEDFLKLDALPNSLLYPDLPGKDTSTGGGSRFSQWFRQDNPSQTSSSQIQGPPQKPQPNIQFDSRRSSLQDEINNMINDFTSSALDEHIPDSNSNKYFAPISPAASTSSNSLLELFQRSEKQQQQQQQQHQQMQHQQREREHLHPHPLQHQPPPTHGPQHPMGHPPNNAALHHQQQQQHQHQQMQNRSLQQLLGVGGPPGGNTGNIQPSPNVGQIHSVEELEARFRQNDATPRTGNNGVTVASNPNNGPTIPRLITPSSNIDQQQEMNAFKKLMAQISDNQPGHHPHNAPHPPGTHPPHHQAPHPINMLHHQQQQNELLQKMLHLNQMHHPMNDARQAEILKRPEAQALLHGIARGEVSQHNLFQQLVNPATAQHHRDIVSCVLSTFGTSPRVVSPNILIQPTPGSVPILPQAAVPPAAAVAAAAANNANLLFQHHSKQQMRLSPLPSGMPQRIPSPRELQFHTQSIMQNALIRKKLEEQRENYRKRQEQQAQQQQNRQQETSSAASSLTSSATTTTTTAVGANQSGVSASGPGNQQGNNTSNSGMVAPSTAIATPVVTSSITSPVKQNQPSHSHSQHTSSPTPLAFTPTSVLRKMTAEKESESIINNNSNQNIPITANANNMHQPNERPPLGITQGQNLLMSLTNPMNQQRNLNALSQSQNPQQTNQPGPLPAMSHPPHHQLGGPPVGQHPNQILPPPMSHQQQPPPPNPQQMRPGQHQPTGMPANIPWNMKQPHPGQQPLPQMSKPQGRPILKGGNNPQPTSQPQMPPQMPFTSNLEFQQQMQQFQNRSGNPILGSHQTPQQQQQHQQQQQMMQQQHNPHQNQMNPHLQQMLQQRQQQQRAIRSQHMQQMPPSFRQQSQAQGAGPGPHPHQSGPGQQAPQGGSGIINYQRDGGLSPTSNQLARWFSPELLAQASAGKLPSLGVGQGMSLEEFERNMQHSSATVHN